MNKYKKLSLVLLGTISLITTPIFASNSLESGWYGDIDIGYTTANGKSYPNSSSSKTGGTGQSFSIGYKFTRFTALEAGYTRYIATRIRNSETITAARDNHYAANIASKIIYPLLNTSVEIYSKIGLAQITSHIGSINTAAAAVNNMTFNTSTQTAVGLYYGLGAQYNISPGLSTHIQYIQARGNSKTGNLGLYSIGLSLLI